MVTTYRAPCGHNQLPPSDGLGSSHRGVHAVTKTKTKAKEPVMILQCQRGTDELNHGTFRFVVNNASWRVIVPDEIGHFFLEDGRAGVFRVEDPGGHRRGCNLPLL